MTLNWNLANPVQRRRALPLLVFALALALAACDNEMNVRPTEPWYPGFTPVAGRSLEISGSLQADNGSIMEATVLYDGLELPLARSRCTSRDGCSELRLAATAQTADGIHTISFMVLEQSVAVVEYRAQGSVLVDREGLFLGGVNLALGPEQVALRPGESVTFTIEFSDEW